ncbi:unnamed protein product [Arabis nemorensis]|uniref:Uncharacterized protein n=1 Tax=Arabis nemorensis TaxID=586526 RepID=A0A565BV67_9BRAS|nr:unnamed protein product [Arabis nemorensis]
MNEATPTPSPSYISSSEKEKVRSYREKISKCRIKCRKDCKLSKTVPSPSSASVSVTASRYRRGSTQKTSLPRGGIATARSLKDATANPKPETLASYGRLQLNLTRGSSESSSLVEQLLDVVTRELDHGSSSSSGSWGDSTKDDKVGALSSYQNNLVELAADALYRAVVNTTRPSLSEKRPRRQHVTSRLVEALAEGKWSWLLEDASMRRSYDSLLWTLIYVLMEVDAVLVLLESIISSNHINAGILPQEVWDHQLFRHIPSETALYFIARYFSRMGCQGNLQDDLHLRGNLLRADCAPLSWKISSCRVPDGVQLPLVLRDPLLHDMEIYFLSITPEDERKDHCLTSLWDVLCCVILGMVLISQAFDSPEVGRIVEMDLDLAEDTTEIDLITGGKVFLVCPFLRGTGSWA